MAWKCCFSCSSSLIPDCSYMMLFLLCVCILFGSSFLSLIKYAVRVDSAAQLPNRESSREKTELEKNCDYVIPPALIQPQCSLLYLCSCQLCLFTLIYLSLLLFRISSFLLSTPAPKFPTLILIHFSSNSHPMFSQFHQIECHS